MKPWIFSSDRVARFVLISLIACVYAGCVMISNHFLFFWAGDEPYRYWLYPPAGLRLLLIMLLGFPAVIGIGIASATIYISPIVPEITGHSFALILGFTESLSVYYALRFYGTIAGVQYPWTGLSWRHIPVIAVLCSTATAFFSNAVRIILNLGNVSSLDRDITLNIIGDIFGTTLLLGLLIIAHKSHLAYTTKISSAQMRSAKWNPH